MLRSVHLKNFVGFIDYQVMDFSNDGPFILIGENSSGKSSVLEGIRRCLKLEFSTSISSVSDSEKISYFICNIETDSLRSNDVVLGIVSNPLNHKRNQDGQDESQKRSGTDEVNSERDSSGNESTTKNTIEEYYKFAISNKDKILIDLITLTKSGDETDLKVSASYMMTNENSPISIDKCIETFSNVNENGKGIEDCITSILVNLDKASNTFPDKLKEKLRTITEQFVFTFPSRSMAPYQWSESKRHTIKHRNENYKEAEDRCEIINHYYTCKHLLIDKFDYDKEKSYFSQVTQGADDNFEQMVTGDGRPKRGRFALIKTPEGILGAKEFSILISSKQYKTFLLEEPDRGMHPQFVERMLQIMKKVKNNERVILTTHQKGLITPWTILDTFIFRRSEEGNRIISGKSILNEGEVVSMKDIRLFTSQHISDIFFASKVLFYEGDSEELFLGELKSQIVNSECSITSRYASDKLKNSLIEYTFIKMNGEGQSEFYHEVCVKLKLKHLILLDKDKCKTELPENDHIFHWKDGDIESMVLNMCRNNTKLTKELLKENIISISSNDNTLRIKWRKSKTKGKLFLDKRIKDINIRRCVTHLLDHCEAEDDLAAFIKRLMK